MRTHSLQNAVRTPLNSVCMGLSILQGELARNLGFKSADDLLLHPDEVPKGVSVEQRKQHKDWFELSHEVHTNAQSSVDVLNDLLNFDKVR